MHKTVIWAADGSDGADAALTEARRLVDPDGGRIIAAHCNQRLTGRAAAYPALPDEDDRLVKIRSQADELVSEGFDGDLVVCRSHHSQRLLHVATCPVMAVPTLEVHLPEPERRIEAHA